MTLALIYIILVRRQYPSYKFCQTFQTLDFIFSHPIFPLPNCMSFRLQNMISRSLLGVLHNNFTLLQLEYIFFTSALYFVDVKVVNLHPKNAKSSLHVYHIPLMSTGSRTTAFRLDSGQIDLIYIEISIAQYTFSIEKSPFHSIGLSLSQQKKPFMWYTNDVFIFSAVLAIMEQNKRFMFVYYISMFVDHTLEGIYTLVGSLSSFSETSLKCFFSIDVCHAGMIC